MEDPDNTQWAARAYYYTDLIFKIKVNVPMIGASGAIMGIVGAFAMYFPNVRLMLIFPPIALKAKYMVMVFVVASLFLGVSNLALTNVAHFAHLGGVFVGLILSLIWKRNQFNNFRIN
jgi:membrane associated rhomboid family serine protease